MTIRHLKVFIKVCELSSITKAAEYLNVAQPSISETIKDLENYYNVSLFSRVNKKLILTKDGETLLVKARSVVNEFDEFENIANKIETSNKVYIGSTMAFGVKGLPYIFETIRKEVPNIDTRMYIDRPIDLENKIIKGELDFAFTERLPSSNSIETKIIGHDHLIAICAKEANYPNELDIKDLVNYDLCLREQTSSSRTRIDQELDKVGTTITDPKLECINNELILSAVKDNVGIGILPNFIAQDYINKGIIKEIKLNVNLDRNLYIISLKDKKLTKLAKKAYNIAFKLVEKGPGSF